MADRGLGDYFIDDPDHRGAEQDDAFGATFVAPIAPRVVPEPARTQPPDVGSEPSVGEGPSTASRTAPAAVPFVQQPAGAASQTSVRRATREEQLVRALDDLMSNDVDIQAAALVSLDGFAMASALPAGMDEDRVAAMSAAILGLGERAAAELGRGSLSQVFIEGDTGYVLLMAAGSRAVLTALAEKRAKLGLVLYDMKTAAQIIGRVLG